MIASLRPTVLADWERVTFFGVLTMAGRIWPFLLLLFCFLVPGRAEAETVTPLQVRTEAIVAQQTDRAAGTAGAQRSAEYLASELQRITGEKVYRQRFALVVPVVEKCVASAVRGGGVKGGVAEPEVLTEIPLAPLLPSSSQLAALAGEYRDLPAVYIGAGRLQDLAGQTLANHLVVLEISSDPIAWQTAAALGARGIIFVGGPDTRIRSFLDKAARVPVSVPRFYCDDPSIMASLRKGSITRIRFDLSVRWQEKQVENLLCLIPGRQQTADLAHVVDKRWFEQLVVVQARYDASSQVLTQAPGATQALNAAAALALAESLAAAPDRTSTLIVLTAGDEWNNRGTRTLYELLGRHYGNPARYDEELPKHILAAEKSLQDAGTIVDALGQLADPAATIAVLRNPLISQALGDQLRREGSALEGRLQKARLQEWAVNSSVPSAARVSLEAAKDLHTSVLSALEKQLSFSSEQQAILATAAGAVRPLWLTEQMRRGQALKNLRDWLEIRRAVGASARYPKVHLTLAFAAGGKQFGFFARSHYSNTMNQSGRMAPVAKDFGRYGEFLAEAARGEGRAGSTFLPDSMGNRYTLDSYFTVPIAFSSDGAILHGQPAGAFATVQDPSGVQDTPADTVARLNYPHVQQQLVDLTRLLLGHDAHPGALTDPQFQPRVELQRNAFDQGVTLLERTLGESVPSLGAPGILLGGEPEYWNSPLGGGLMGTRRMEWYITNVDGTATFKSCSPAFRIRMEACDFDAEGLPVRVLAMNQADTNGMAWFFTPGAGPMRALLFDCQRLDAFGLFDPRYLEHLDKIEVLDAQRHDKARYTSILARDGMASVFMPRGIRWQLLIAKGAVGNRMLLLNADAAHPEGRGFATTDLAEIGPLAYRNALDLSALNQHRQAELEKFGISSDLLKDLQRRSASAMQMAAAAREERDYLLWFGATNSAWSLQAQIYQNLIDTSNGIIKGVIFLLLGILPFSYFLERLLIASTNVYRQIMGFAGIFVVMTGLLWFHPAFRISSAPLMILLAFLILMLSILVIYILFGKFEEELARLRGQSAASHSASLRRGAVLGAAIQLGLSNMRRRGTRTALTLTTLVLLTFTMLCFTSVHESVQLTPRLVPNALPDAPPGIMLRLRDWRPLPLPARQLAAQLANSGGDPTGDARQTEPATQAAGAHSMLAERWWFSSDNPEQPWFVPVRPVSGNGASAPNGRAFFASGLIGLEATEAAFHTVPLERLFPGFAQLAANPSICWLPASLRDSTGLAPGDSVEILGNRLTLAGFFDEQEFQKLRTLTGDEFTPIDPTGAVGTSSTTAGTLPEDIAATPEATYRFLSPGTVVIVPAELTRRIGGRLSSIMIRPAGATPDNILSLAEEFSRRSIFTVYVADGTAVRSLNAIESMRPQDLDAILIPMLIAGVIVLNTMLGAVAERTKEIHVYTSVGLAPAHVGMLFLAEAAALGTLGVVFGYVFGQGLATILSATGLMSGVDLNYSSMAAVLTMGLILLLVMASSLWPAYSATRVAAPSLNRHWKLPAPQGDVLRVDLPFTVNATAARGVCGFLHEFLHTTSLAGTGRFTADQIEVALDSVNGAPIRTLTCRVWLAPYDLGVMQNFSLTIHPTDAKNVLEVRLQLTRQAGNPATWHRLNRVFLIEIRKQFLLWRALSPAHIQLYLDKSTALFAGPVAAA